MNQFQHLDSIFPVGAKRLSGEVVSVSVTVQFSEEGWVYGFFNRSFRDPVLSWKRKAWYVNASVNAYHLHRGLCKEFRDCPKPANMDIPERHERAVKRLLAAVTMNSYLVNYRDGGQYHSYLLTVDSSVDRSPSAWWQVGEDDYREICVDPVSSPIFMPVIKPRRGPIPAMEASLEAASDVAWSDCLKDFDPVKVRKLLDGGK